MTVLNILSPPSVTCKDGSTREKKNMNLERGANFSLTKLMPETNNAYIGLDWSNSLKADTVFDIDGSCFLLNDQNHVRRNQDFIF